MKTQSATTNQVNASKKLDELNNFLMSHIDSNATKCTHNLANLRDILNAGHKINNPKINPHESLNLLIDFLRSEQKDNNNNQIIGQHQTDTIINRIENDLQESLKILKQYNEKIEQDRSDLEMESFRKSIKYEKIRDEQENENNEPCRYNFNRNDAIRKNFFAKSENLGEKLKRLSQINKTNSISEASNRVNKASSRDLSRKSSSPCVRQINTQRRNSFDHTALLENSKPKTLTKSNTSQFDKINSIGNELPMHSCGKRHSESGFWKYDELNELKQKFISLLSDSNEQETKSYKQENPEGFSNKFSPMSFVSNQNKAISSSEQLKIESFYRSFGTSLFISQSCASLYTVQNSKIWPLTKSQTNRISIATTHSINLNYQGCSNDEISHDILKDLMNERHQNYVPTYHRGVPLWLFNSGKNPHRPIRQLKFTLAEKGTGFILWQDRIDSNSEFNFYLTKKNDSTVYNVSSYFDNLSLINEIKKEQIESMLVAFKASDKKTTVFMKFDLNTETIKFYEFYKRLIKNIAIDTKLRTKSLPVGYSNCNSYSRIKRNQQARNNISFYNYDYNLLESGSSTIKNKSKRQSCQIVSEPKERGKPKRVSKNDISSPCNYKHVISLKASDRDLYYTLSKLLPNSSSGRSSSPKYAENKLESPQNYSVSSSSASSAMSSPITPSINCMSNEYLIQDSSRSSLNPDVLNDRSSSSLSNSSLSTILPPFIGVSNGNKFFEMNSYNYKISRQRTVK